MKRLKSGYGLVRQINAAIGESASYEIDQRSLDVFRAVAESGSATNAAELIGMSQPAVTKIIAELERACALVLFERDRYGMRLTADGQLLYDEVLRNLSGLDRIRRSIRAIRGGKRGDLRIVALPVLAEGTIGQMIGEYMRDLSDLHINLEVDTPEGILRLVSLQHADFGILFGPVLKLPHLETKVLGRCALVAVLSNSHPFAARNRLAMADLLDQTLVMLTPPHPIRTLVERIFSEAGKQPRISCEATTQKIVANLACAGAGVGLIDSETARQVIHGEMAIVPIDPPILWDICAVRHRQLHTSAAAHALMRWLLSKRIAQRWAES